MNGCLTTPILLREEDVPWFTSMIRFPDDLDEADDAIHRLRVILNEAAEEVRVRKAVRAKSQAR
jgi:hypothetical protein